MQVSRGMYFPARGNTKRSGRRTIARVGRYCRYHHRPLRRITFECSGDVEEQGHGPDSNDHNQRIRGYRFSLLPPAQYTVSPTASGFQTVDIGALVEGIYQIGRE